MIGFSSGNEVMGPFIIYEWKGFSILSARMITLGFILFGFDVCLVKLADKSCIVI